MVQTSVDMNTWDWRKKQTSISSGISERPDWLDETVEQQWYLDPVNVWANLTFTVFYGPCSWTVLSPAEATEPRWCHRWCRQAGTWSQELRCWTTVWLSYPERKSRNTMRRMWPPWNLSTMLRKQEPDTLLPCKHSGTFKMTVVVRGLYGNLADCVETVQRVLEDIQTTYDQLRQRKASVINEQTALKTFK